LQNKNAWIARVKLLLQEGTGKPDNDVIKALLLKEN
jgi:hypothetical protein